MSKDITPTLSIIMPTFNHEKELAVMIDSIIGNTYGDWELLAVDDGSNETTIHLLLDYAQNDHRIKLIRRNRLPKGAPTCRNIGIDEARGKYIVFFDSDDYITPVCLANRIEKINTHRDLDFMVFPSGLFVDGKFLAVAHKLSFGYKTIDDDIMAFARRTLPFIVWNNIYKAESIKSHHLYWNEKLCSLQDAEYNISAITKGLKYEYVPTEADYGYRINTTGSISKNVGNTIHHKSHQEYLESTFCMIQKEYGHTYDKAVYEGILLLYNSITTGQGNNYELANLFASVLERHSPSFFKRFIRKIEHGRLLEKIISPKLARQIPMTGFLLNREYRERHRIIAISKIIKAIYK